jgi:hypothetical protein
MMTPLRTGILLLAVQFAAVAAAAVAAVAPIGHEFREGVSTESSSQLLRFPYTPSNLKLNADFSLRPDIEAISGAHEIDWETRLEWQRRRYRNNPTFGLLENKLLSHSLLSDLDIPQLAIYYGAFARKSLGQWPEYNRDDFIKTLSETQVVASDHLFVLKPASDGWSENVLLMNQNRWDEEEWNIERLADFTEKFLFTHSYSGFGMK